MRRGATTNTVRGMSPPRHGLQSATVPTLAQTSLTDEERPVVERLVDLMRERFGDRLRSVWLYGSRARGERPGPESDIDLLAIADRTDDDDDVLAAILLVDRAAEELRVPRPIVSIKVHDPAWLEGRRAIDSFFIREVDRDKVVLYGEP
jgi:predicted nucleotidyltransferase